MSVQSIQSSQYVVPIQSNYSIPSVHSIRLYSLSSLWSNDYCVLRGIFEV